LLLTSLTIAAEEASPTPPGSSLLADLPPEVWEVLDEHRAALEAADAPSVLETVYQASTPYEFSGGSLVVRTDPRWFATLPSTGAGGALLELRRWPGDSVLSLYAIQRQAAAKAARVPPIPDSEMEPLDDSRKGMAAWEGWVHTAAGERPALWIEREVQEGQPWLGALLLPGDAGLGDGAIATLTEEMMGVLRRVEIRPAAWKAQTAVPASVDLILPFTPETPGDGREDSAPWQVARGSGFTIGLPPGFRARPMDGGVPPARELPGGLLWFRGRCVDMDGNRLVVGDEDRFGYVARVEQPDKQWSDGDTPPLGATAAKRAVVEPFGLLAERSGADRATAERWTESGFGGQWFVFRMVFSDHGYEIGIPVVAGRTSPSLIWIAATWRDDRRPPAAPPVDPAERFGIKFERLTRVEREKQPWMEGFLTVPGLRLEVSRGWVPLASLRSEDGYPIRFVDETGTTIGLLTRVGPDEMKERESALAVLTPLEKPGRFRAAAVYRDQDRTQLFVASSGEGYLFELVNSASRPAEASGEEIDELWDLMLRSVRLRPS
jgi:hypothetical protein